MAREVGADERFLVFRCKQQIIDSEPRARTHGDFSVDRSTRPQPVLREASRLEIVPLWRSAQASVPPYRLDHVGAARP